MKTNVLWQIAATFGSLSLVAVGGANAVIPDIHRQVVDVYGWMNDATFAGLFALSQAAPGPNVLLVSLIGWRVAGLAGLLVATAAILIPAALLALAAGRVVARWAETAWIRAARDGLVPIALGLILASGVVTARAADHSALAFLITGATAGFVLVSGRNPLWALAGATAAGLAGWLFGVQP
jgi:chromate transporter